MTFVELAKMCARNAHSTTSKDVADELWQMAKEYQAKAAKLGTLPELATHPQCGNRRDSHPSLHCCAKSEVCSWHNSEVANDERIAMASACPAAADWRRAAIRFALAALARAPPARRAVGRDHRATHPDAHGDPETARPTNRASRRNPPARILLKSRRKSIPRCNQSAV